MPNNEGHRPRTSHSITALNRFFSPQEAQPRPSTNVVLDSVPISTRRSSSHFNHDYLNPTPSGEASRAAIPPPENIFKRTFDMVERVTKRSNSRAVRTARPDFSSPSIASLASIESASSSFGLQRRESISSSGGSIRTARRLFNSLRQRRGAVSGASGQTLSQTQRMSRHSEEVLRTHWSNLPSQPFQPGSGSAAKAAAQQANLDRQQLLSAKQKQLRADTPEDPMDVDSAYEAEDDRASNVDMGPKLDPLAFFPAEITVLIFNHLDQAALRNATQVCKSWHQLAESPPIWRTSFLSTYQRRASIPPPYIQMGGLGLGEPNKPDQPWKAMAKARWQLENAWNKTDPKAIYFNGHTDSVYCCQFDEKKLITGSRDRTIRVWDLETYDCIKVIGGPAAKPVMAQSQQLLDVAPTTYRNYPSVNGTRKGDEIFHVPRDYHSASILCLQYDSEIMVTGSSDNSCIVWNIHTFEPIRRLRRHAAGVLDVCIDARFIISCSKDATICVWDRKTLELVKQLEGHRGPVNAVQLRGNFLVSASGDGKSKLWDMESLSHVRDYESRDRGLAAVEFSDDGRYVLAGGNDQVIYKYDAQTADLLHTMKGHGGLVRSLFLDYSNKRVLSGSYDQGIRVYDFESGEQKAVYDNWTTSWILAAKSDYRRIVATSQDGRALLMDFGLNVPAVELLSGLPKSKIDPDAQRAAQGRKARSMSYLKREDSAGLTLFGTHPIHDHRPPPLHRDNLAKRPRVQGLFGSTTPTWPSASTANGVASHHANARTSAATGGSETSPFGFVARAAAAQAQRERERERERDRPRLSLFGQAWVQGLSYAPRQAAGAGAGVNVNLRPKTAREPPAGGSGNAGMDGPGMSGGAG